MIRTVEVAPNVYAQGDLIRQDGDRATVRDGSREYTGTLVQTWRNDK